MQCAEQGIGTRGHLACPHMEAEDRQGGRPDILSPELSSHILASVSLVCVLLRSLVDIGEHTVRRGISNDWGLGMMRSRLYYLLALALFTTIKTGSKY